MAFITLNTNKLKDNFKYLDNLFSENNIEWSIVTKVLCGNKTYLKETLSLGIKQVCDSRITNLRAIKSINPNIETIYIKPPSKNIILQIIEIADISFNTDYYTLKLLSDEAGRKSKKHKVIIMLELGELREGVLRDKFLEFFDKVYKLPNIEVMGIGANLSCLYGVLPNEDKLIQLVLYKQILEMKFNKTIPIVSGGSSVTIPLILWNQLPTGINHFRVGETLFFGTNVYNGNTIPEMHNDVIKLFAQIIELYEKPSVPSGELCTNVEGKEFSFSEEDLSKTSFRAIIDVGILDTNTEHLFPTNENYSIVGASSDMVVIDLVENNDKLKVGDFIEFRVDYIAALHLLHSKYIDKNIE